MAGNAMETVLVVGVLGAGGYLFYEYSQYSSAMNTVAQANGLTAASLESILPFFTWLSFNWMGTGSGTAQQQQIYSVMQSAASGLPSPTQAPGTTSPSQTTSVSTSPGTTTTTTASSSPTVPALTPARAAATGIVIGSARIPATGISVRAGAARTANALAPARK